MRGGDLEAASDVRPRTSAKQSTAEPAEIAEKNIYCFVFSAISAGSAVEDSADD
jgi:hypothetical protein